MNELNQWIKAFDRMRREGTRQVRFQNDWNKSIRSMLNTGAHQGEKPSRADPWSKRLIAEVRRASLPDWSAWEKRIRRMVDGFYLRPKPKPPKRRPPSRYSDEIRWIYWIKREAKRANLQRKHSEWDQKIQSWRTGAINRRKDYKRGPRPTRWNMVQLYGRSVHEEKQTKPWEKVLNGFVTNANRRKK